MTDAKTTEKVELPPRATLSRVEYFALVKAIYDIYPFGDRERYEHRQALLRTMYRMRARSPQ